MRTIILIKILLCCVVGFAQNQTIQITYNKKYEERRTGTELNKIDSISKTTPVVTARVASIKKSLASVEHILLFNKEQSYFYTKDAMENDNGQTANSRAITLGGTRGRHSLNITTKRREWEARLWEDKRYTVEEPYEKYDWELINEKKIVLGYQVYKAITTIEYSNKRRKGSYNVEAWYAPDLVSNFGPASYSGLPGTVLELWNGNVGIYAVDIKVLEEELSYKPFKGKRVKADQLSQISDEYITKRIRGK